LYREACTDLMLAEAHDLPRETVAYLHTLVARAHSAVYRSRGVHLSDFAALLLREAPTRLRNDPAFRIAIAVFVAVFLICGLLAAGQAGFAETVVGEQTLEQIDQMYSEPLDQIGGDGSGRSDAIMAGFYILNNTSIGLRCFAWGIVLGLGSLLQLVFQALYLGTIFGHMLASPNAAQFYSFVTAHSAFELSAIVISGGAGLRMGWGLVETKGETRLASLKRETAGILPTVAVAAVWFFFAALIEGFVSASKLPYPGKLAVALLSSLAIIVYLGLGRRIVPGADASSAGIDFVPARSNVEAAALPVAGHAHPRNSEVEQASPDAAIQGLKAASPTAGKSASPVQSRQ
jgi:uncharacterized membrane protein SpoIIM required for sporulation